MQTAQFATLSAALLDRGRPLAQTARTTPGATRASHGPALDRTFVAQLAAADDAEQEYVCEELSKMGVDPEGKEREGSYHAHFYLARPAGEAEANVEELVFPALR